VIDAAAAGRFAIQSVGTIDEALGILTGVAPGVPDAEGRYEAGTLNARVDAELTQLAERARSFAAPERKEGS
jgi:hypothetical protein